MLIHDLHYWSALRVHYRPSEFQFLTDIQAGRADVDGAWPDHEDAFALFCDLVLLQKFVQPVDKPFYTYSEDQDQVHALFMSRFEGRIHGNGYEMLQFCDIVPHLWCSNRRVSARWSGFDGPLPDSHYSPHLRMRKIPPSMPQDEDADEDSFGFKIGERTAEEKNLFPVGYNMVFKQLKRRVYESLDDWRCIDANDYSDYRGLVLHVGKSKRTGRWLGYVGIRDFHPLDHTLDVPYRFRHRNQFH